MGVSEIYGVDSADPGDEEPQRESTNSASDAEFEPGNSHRTHEGGQPADDVNQQIRSVSSASPPTQSAVEEIERLMAAGAHPVDAATPFLGGTTHAFDAADSAGLGSQPGDGATGGRGWLRRLLGGAGDAAAPTEDEDLDGSPGTAERERGGEGDSDEAAPGAGSRRFPVRPVHAALGAAFAVAVLVAALMLGRTPGTDSAVTTAPMAGAPAPAANPADPQIDRTQLPIAVEKGDVLAQCESGSTDAYGAFSHEEGAAWKCLAPYDGVGQVLAITLPDGPYVITEVRMMPGFDAADKDGSDQWAKHRVVSKVTWRFDDGTRVPQEFDGSRRQQVVSVPEAVTNRVTVTIQKTDAPAPVDTPISASAPAPPIPGGGNVPNWLDDTNWLPSVPGSESASGGDRAEEPKAFAISSIEIVGYPVRRNSAR
ncbi:hypothetical protein AB4Z39_32475 [Mycobacterium adipatum]|uniref:hypothetical protein n=1 Tax=Mycobacterium adipatum TaxID=1682113 RepID=UPI0034E0D06B